MQRAKIGKVKIPKGAIPKQHELTLAEILVHTGYDISFVAVGPNKTPDIYFQEKYWEIKSPTGASSRTIENNLRTALTQSENVILDLRRTAIADDKALLYIKNHIANFRGLKRLIVVAKTTQIYKISPKSTCISKIRMLK